MFVAELHDIAKLLDRLALNLEVERFGLGGIKGQSFDGVQFDPDKLPQPRTETWSAIIRHESDKSWESFQSIPASTGPEELEARRQRFVVTLADRFASSIAREWTPQYPESLRVKKLWGTESQDRTIKDFAGFRSLLDFVNSDLPPEQFFARYAEALHSIPEDRRAPFTSLHNHLRLVGKIARQLDTEIRLQQNNGRWAASFRGHDAESIDDAHGSTAKNILGKWKFVLVKAYVEFPHFIVRLQDLNILYERSRALELLAEHYPDNVLYFTENFALLFFPDFTPEIAKDHSQFQWCFRVIESDLTTMSSNLDIAGRFDQLNSRKHGARVRQSRWPVERKAIIEGPLCPVCQQESATEKWLKGDLEESLCRPCFIRRETAPPADAYARWDELGSDVAWIRLAVWPDAVRDVVTKLFAQAVNNDPKVFDAFRPLPLEMDFLDDYSKLRETWRETLGEKILAEQLMQPVAQYPELLIVRLDPPNLWLRAVEAFSDALARYMPRLADDSAALVSPVQLFVDITSTKFPFQEHWRYFSRPGTAAINLRNPIRSIEISLPVAHFRRLFELTHSVEYRRPVHELATLFEATNSRGAVLLSAWEKRLGLEKKLKAHGVSVTELVQLARMVSA